MAISDVRAKETKKTKQLIPRVVQVPTGVKQVALPNWKALQKNLDFSFLAARFLFPLFWGLSTNPFLDGLTVVLKNRGLHIRKLLRKILGVYKVLCLVRSRFVVICVFVSKLVWARFDAGHVLARSLLDASAVLRRDGTNRTIAASSSSAWSRRRARSACNVAAVKRDDSVCGTLHAGFAGRHGDQQRSPGGRGGGGGGGGQRAPSRGCLVRRVSENVTIVRPCRACLFFRPTCTFVFPSSFSGV